MIDTQIKAVQNVVLLILFSPTPRHSAEGTGSRAPTGEWAWSRFGLQGHRTRPKLAHALANCAVLTVYPPNS